MNNQFVKDSLLPDEKILATAKFHPLKNLIVSIVLLLASVALFIVFGNSHSTLLHNRVHLHSYYNYATDTHYKLFQGMDNSSDDRGEKYVRGQYEPQVFPHMTISEYEAMTGVDIRKNDYRLTYFMSSTKILLWWFITIVIVIGVYLLVRWINSKDEFVITNKRVVAKVGVIRRIAFELLIEQMESIEVHQGIIGRILKFGTEMPCGVGASKVRIPFVVNPFEFRQHFYDIKKVSEPTPTISKPTTPQAPTTEQKYFAQPQSDGKFHIVEKNSVTGEFVTIKGEVYDTEFEARKRAKELNAEYNS